VAGPLVLAHRGASADAPENTVAAFTLARDQGADGVELDVRRTADGVLVVHHDPDVPGVGRCADLSFDALRAAAPAVPTLEEALDACAGLLVNIEIKCLPWEPDADPDHEVARAVARLVAARGTPVVISSFDLGTVDAVKAAAPGLPTGYLVHGQDVGDAARRAHAGGHEWLHPDRAAVLADPARAVAAARAHGVRLDVWTVDDAAELRALVAAGVDAVITNVPARAVAVRAVYDRRGGPA
jgi:glycerophosphoryl diester phosphodiesterase